MRGHDTAVVLEIPGYSITDLATAVAGYAEAPGWTAMPATEVAREIAELAASFPAGTVLERRLDEVIARDEAAAS